MKTAMTCNRTDGIPRYPRAALAMAASLALAGCSGGGGGGSDGPAAPSGVVAFAGDGMVTLTWAPVPHADSYNIYWSTTTGVSKATGTPILGVKAPYQHTGLVNLQDYHYVVTSVDGKKEGHASSEVSSTPRLNAGQFDPPWATVPPTQVLSIAFDANQTPEANGLLLASQIAALMPGDRLEIGDGNWSMPNMFSIDLMGSAMAPIWIAAATGTRPRITRVDNTDAVTHIGAAGGARYLALIGFEIDDGDRGIDLWDAREVWINLNLLSGTGNTPIAGDNFTTSKLYITRNQIDHAGGDGHGIVLGTNDAMFITMNSVIAQNQISDCRGADATGLWVRQGSFGNWIAENTVHDTDWPCILVAGAGTNAWNTIERNTCYNSNDNVMEVQSQAYVRNNLLINGTQGFSSQDDFDTVRELEVVHNTIINTGRGVNLDNWGGKTGLVFANNVVYSKKGDSIRFPLGSAGVYFNGNVVLGPVLGTAAGYINGTGLADFVDAAWDASHRDATPSLGGPIIDSADPAMLVPDDLTGKPRNTTTNESGCLDA